MLKQLLSAVVAVAVVSQGIAMADEPVPSAQVVVARDRVALIAHLDAMAAGDRVVVATAEGVIAGELVDHDAGDVLIDRPLVEGGAERIAIPVSEIQGIQYQTTGASQREKAGKAIVVVALVGVAVWLLHALTRPMP